MTLDMLNVQRGDIGGRTFDTVSNHMLVNHNCWVYVRSFLEANELAFLLKSEADKAVPQNLLDLLEFIENLLSVENWHAELKKHQKLLHSVFPIKGDKITALEADEFEERSTEDEWLS